MNCKTFQRNLEDYLQGGLDFPGRFAIERHAEQCFHCGKVVGDAQKIGRLAREMEHVTAPTDFEDAVLRKIQAEVGSRESGAFRRFWVYGMNWAAWKPVALAASVLVMAGAGLYYSIPGYLPGEPAASDLPRAAHELPVIPLLQQEAGEELLSESAAPPGLVPLSQMQAVNTGIDSLLPSPSGLSTEDERALPLADAADADYVELLIPGPGDQPLIMRLPKTIRMRHGQPSEEYFIRKVSH